MSPLLGLVVWEVYVIQCFKIKLKFPLDVDKKKVYTILYRSIMIFPFVPFVISFVPYDIPFFQLKVFGARICHRSQIRLPDILQTQTLIY